MLGIVSLLISLIPFVGPLLQRPRIQVERTYTDERQILADGEVKGQAQFAHVCFRNKPPWPWLVNTLAATHLQAQISLYHPDKQTLSMGPIDGRWGDTDQPPARPLFGSTLELVQITLPPNGKPRELDVALKHNGDAACYAFNNSSYASEGFKRPDYQLPETEYAVEIKLVGDNFGGYRKWFRLTNTGAAQAGLALNECSDE